MKRAIDKIIFFILMGWIVIGVPFFVWYVFTHDYDKEDPVMVIGEDKPIPLTDTSVIYDLKGNRINPQDIKEGIYILKEDSTYQKILR